MFSVIAVAAVIIGVLKWENRETVSDGDTESASATAGSARELSVSVLSTLETMQEIKRLRLTEGIMFYSDGGENPLFTSYMATRMDETVWSFLQGPKAWEGKTNWSGEWCSLVVNGNVFGAFGCGPCCMANIYCTLSGREASPVDLCEFAMSNTGYTVSWYSGAIGWGDMKNALKKCGMDTDVYYKPTTYEQFAAQMEENPTAIVLVSSYCDDTFWEDTSGHYVNIWNYDSSDGTVFLCEPGDPVNNRTRIPLRYVYDALKTTSKFQYLLVSSYDSSDDELKGSGIEENWVRP